VSESPVASLRVPPDHPVFVGHFPGRPLVPGVMLLDWVLREARRIFDCDAHALQVRECKFFDPLLPGETAGLHFDTTATGCGFRVRRGETTLAAGVIELRRD
jgi:3-hydroxyacyl-[acyl-carrier-protein] dehydratase